jgi:hypothetical protein
LIAPNPAKNANVAELRELRFLYLKLKPQEGIGRPALSRCKRRSYYTQRRGGTLIGMAGEPARYSAPTLMEPSSLGGRPK